MIFLVEGDECGLCEYNGLDKRNNGKLWDWSLCSGICVIVFLVFEIEM